MWRESGNKRVNEVQLACIHNRMRLMTTSFNSKLFLQSAQYKVYIIANPR